MTIEQVRQVATARPFQPFQLETTGGRTLSIPHPDHIFFGPPASRTIVIFDPENIANLVNEDHVASLAVRSPA